MSGAFLRAELEWARTGKKEKALRALAASLDAVSSLRASPAEIARILRGNAERLLGP